ncbi:hypothetical protein SDC9_191189 [bioreactor metagenome]|uniref:HTH gntR-type domain-containing protein n=1 Tax=bioreactor metagenome TaxID=1076179 RepID=A0A645HZL1_9ZZZZ
MTWDLKSDRPIYLQLVEHLQLAIVSGRLPAGSRVPPVRELASQAAVNPNTMQKALQELEQSGLIQTQRTSGRIVTEDTDRIQATRQQLAKNQLDAFFEQMQRLGCTRHEILSLVEKELSIV